MANQPLTDAALAAQLDAAGRSAQVRTVTRYVGHHDAEYTSAEDAMLSFEKAALERHLHDHTELEPKEAHRVTNFLCQKHYAHARSDWLVLLEILDVQVNYNPDEN